MVSSVETRELEPPYLMKVWPGVDRVSIFAKRLLSQPTSAHRVPGEMQISCSSLSALSPFCSGATASVLAILAGFLPRRLCTGYRQCSGKVQATGSQQNAWRLLGNNSRAMI